MPLKLYEIEELLKKKNEKFFDWLENRATWNEVIEIDNKILSAFEELSK